jgi:hypothetical protein
MKKQPFRHFFACLITVALCLGAALSQTVTGSITGQVTDPSGALVTGARITATNTATGVKTSVQTNAAGVYTLRFLPIGTYTVSVDAKGFATAQVTPFALEIDQTAKVNVALQVASTATTMEVKEEAHPILDTTDATLGNTLSTNEIQNIPLNGRNFSSLTLFQPGAIDTDPTGMTGNNAIERNTYNSGVAAINGNREQENNYMIEGADNNEPQNNLIGYNPAPDAIAELRVVSANADASFGNANGGQIVAILKSGTNNFHGSAYDLLENQNFDANSWGNGLAFCADCIPPTPASPITKYTQNIFGGTFGGPIVKNKFFFFLDYEGIRYHKAQPLQATSVLTPAMLKGDFSALLNPALPSGPIQLYDTQNNFAPFQNDQVPVVSPIAQYLAAHPDLYPAPNRTPTDGLIQNDYVGSQNGFVTNNQEDFKVDWTPGNLNKISGFYSQGRGADFTSSILPITFPDYNTYPTKITGLSWIHTISPAIVNEARFGFTRVRWHNGVPSDPTGIFGYKGDQIVGIPFPGAQTYEGFTGQSIGNNASYIGTNASLQVFIDNTFNYQDSLTWQRGRHLLTMGGQATRYRQNFTNASNVGFLGQFQYTGTYTSNGNVTNGPGYGPADFVLGRIFNSQLADPLGNVGQRQWRLAGYFQDDYKVLPTLTLNLGVRYEYDQPWYEQNNKTANVVFVNGVATAEYAGHVPAGAAPGSIVCPQNSCYHANYKQIMPRLGFAYQLNPKTVIRGGYGITSFFEGYSFNQRLTSSPPFTEAINQNAPVPTKTSGGTPFTVANAFLQPFGQDPAYPNLYSVWPQDVQPAYIQQYNLTVEHALTNELSVSMGYHGQNGDHLDDYRNGNQLTAQQAQDLNGSPCNASAIPFVDQTPYFALVGECGAILVTESEGRMNYNSGQLTVRQRTHHGLEYTLNYTFAKSLTDSSGNYAVGAQNNNSWNGLSVQNGYDLMADWGPSALDVRHSMNFVGIYDLPFGRGRAYGSNVNRALDTALGGWRFATTALLYTGFPVTIFYPPDNSNTNNAGWGFSRANQYRPLIIRNRSLKNWWGTDPSATPCLQAGVDNGVCAYGEPATNTFGTAKNSTERAPGYRQVDMSLFKDFHLWREGHVLGFRADFFNTFNIASYSNPDNGISDSSFGLISSVRSPARQIQLSLHYSF